MCQAWHLTPLEASPPGHGWSTAELRPSRTQVSGTPRCVSLVRCAAEVGRRQHAGQMSHLVWVASVQLAA